MSGRLWLERTWSIWCSRCSNAAESDEIREDDAIARLAASGWSNESGNNYCPGCNGVRK